MTEVLFILTAVFVAYVVYAVIDEKKLAAKQATPAIKPDVQVAVEQLAVEQPKPQIIEPEKQPVAIKKAAAKAEHNTGKGGRVRDPKTGEIASIGSNYRFTKRWVKDALVTEGLLGKVYKNNELNTETETAIKDALVKLEMLDKYRA